MKTSYLMENEEEVRRLEMKTDAAVVESFARRAGLEKGMRVADICCGAGMTTSILSEVVGDSGSAVGFDASAERIDYASRRYGNARTSFVRADIRKPFDDAGTFDFAWVRFALEYYRKESFEITGNIASLLKKGGILCLIDLDHNSLNHYGISARLETAIFAILKQMEEKGNFDPYAGRKLYSHLYRLGFSGIRAEAGVHHLIYGELREVDAYNWIKKIETISGHIAFDIPGYASRDEFLADFKAFFADPARFTYTPLIACSGRKP